MPAGQGEIQGIGSPIASSTRERTMVSSRCSEVSIGQAGKEARVLQPLEAAAEAELHPIGEDGSSAVVAPAGELPDGARGSREVVLEEQVVEWLVDVEREHDRAVRHARDSRSDAAVEAADLPELLLRTVGGGEPRGDDRWVGERRLQDGVAKPGGLGDRPGTRKGEDLGPAAVGADDPDVVHGHVLVDRVRDPVTIEQPDLA